MATVRWRLWFVAVFFSLHGLHLGQTKSESVGTAAMSLTMSVRSQRQSLQSHSQPTFGKLLHVTECKFCQTCHLTPSAHEFITERKILISKSPEHWPCRCKCATQHKRNIGHNGEGVQTMSRQH